MQGAYLLVCLLLQCVEALQEAAVPSDSETGVIRFKEIIIRILKSLQDPRAYGQQWTNKNVTRFLIDFRDELRYNEVAVETLIRAGLVNLPQFDMALAQCMENGPNYRALNLATALVQNFVIDDRTNQCLSDNDFVHTIEMLTKINTHARQPPDNLSNVIDMLRQHQDQSAFFTDRPPAGATAHIHNGILQVRFESPLYFSKLQQCGCNSFEKKNSV